MPYSRRLLLDLSAGIRGVPVFSEPGCHNSSRPEIYFRIFGVPEVFETYRLLHTVLFLTHSVFRVLFAYFDEPMASNRVYKPYKSCNTVCLTAI